MTLPGAGVWMLVMFLASARQVPFGRHALPVFLPDGAPAGVALLLTDGTLAGIDAAADLRRAGALTVVVDAERFLAESGQGRRKCTLADIDFEALAKVTEKLFGLPSYRPAALVGVGPRGAALAYATLAQSPPGTFAGAVSVGFCPELRAPAPLCHERGLTNGAAQKADGQGSELAAAVLHDPWTVVGGGRCGDTTARTFAEQVSLARYTAPAPGAASSAALAALALTATPGRSTAAASLPDLPLREIEVAPTAPGRMAEGVSEGAADGASRRPGDSEAARLAAQAAGDALVVLVSGDGGWTGFDRDVGVALGHRGVPVVGLDALRYFWIERSPDEVGRDLARVLDAYLPAWGKHRAILVGYSQGADIMPFMAAGLSPALREKVALVALIGPDPQADFSVDLAGWGAPAARPRERPVLPEFSRLRGLPLLCVYGAREVRSLCPLLDARQATLLRLAATGHYYGEHTAQIADAILERANGAPIAAPQRPAPPQHAMKNAHAGHAARTGHAG